MRSAARSTCQRHTHPWLSNAAVYSTRKAASQSGFLPNFPRESSRPYTTLAYRQAGLARGRFGSGYTCRQWSVRPQDTTPLHGLTGHRLWQHASRRDARHNLPGDQLPGGMPSAPLTPPRRSTDPTFMRRGIGTATETDTAKRPASASPVRTGCHRLTSSICGDCSASPSPSPSPRPISTPRRTTASAGSVRLTPPPTAAGRTTISSAPPSAGSQPSATATTTSMIRSAASTATWASGFSATACRSTRALPGHGGLPGTLSSSRSAQPFAEPFCSISVPIAASTKPAAASTYAKHAKIVQATFRIRQFRRFRPLLVEQFSIRLRQGRSAEELLPGLTELVTALGMAGYEADYIRMEAETLTRPAARPEPGYVGQARQLQSEHEQRLNALRNLPGIAADLREQLTEQEEQRFRDQMLALGNAEGEQTTP